MAKDRAHGDKDTTTCLLVITLGQVLHNDRDLPHSKTTGQDPGDLCSDSSLDTDSVSDLGKVRSLIYYEAERKPVCLWE